jgi:preprotein translocase subunit SecY
MIAVEALPQVAGGYLLPNTQLAASMGVSAGFISFLIFLQICVGGALILFMDEVVSKWGVGSGVSLFIVAGVSQQLVNGLINPAKGDFGLPVGFIPRWIDIFRLNLITLDSLFTREGLGYILITGGSILALVSTIIIILMVIFVESTRIEIPLAHSRVRGARGRFPVKLVYASVLPMILVRALQANIQMIGSLMASKLGTVTTATVTAGEQTHVYTGYSGLLGNFTSTATYNAVTGAPLGASSPQAVSGLYYYLSPIHGPSNWLPGMQTTSAMTALGFAPITTWQALLHVLTDASVLIIGGIIFALFWVETTGMGAKSVSEKIHRSGLQIPGYRRSPTSIEKLMERYIPKVTVIGGVVIGLLTLIASLLGTIGGVGGTGLLLTVSIVYRLYEQIASEQIQEMYPMMQKFFGAST